MEGTVVRVKHIQGLNALAWILVHKESTSETSERVGMNVHLESHDQKRSYPDAISMIP